MIYVFHSKKNSIVIHLQSLSSVCRSPFVRYIANSLLHLSLGAVCIQIKLTVRSVTEDFGTNPNLVWPNIKIISEIFDKCQHCIIVVLPDAA